MVKLGPKTRPVHPNSRTIVPTNPIGFQRVSAAFDSASRCLTCPKDLKDLKERTPPPGIPLSIPDSNHPTAHDYCLGMQKGAI